MSKLTNAQPAVFCRKQIRDEGPDSKNPLAFKHYEKKREVLGKTMAEHLRFAVCYWHTYKGAGSDPFGPGTTGVLTGLLSRRIPSPSPVSCIFSSPR